MKKTILTALLLLAILFLLPLLVFRQALAGGVTEKEDGKMPEKTADAETTVRVALASGTVEEMTMEEYLRQVVAAEMPAAFEKEALCAQAAAARTYTAARMRSTSARHPDADVCTDSACCQAWMSAEEAAERWGERAGEYEARIAQAVRDTDGLVAVYEGEPIRAVFFSSSAGRTLPAVEVWGSEVPYLTGVESPEGEEVPHYRTEVAVSADELRESICAGHPEADFSGAPESWLGKIVPDSAGGVKSMSVAGVSVSGREMRSLFSLRSTHFTVTEQDGTFLFTVTGYGHGVGMSQYGANAMAKAGSTWREILCRYYTGVEIVPLADLR